MVQRIVYHGAWAVLGIAMVLVFAIDVAIVATERIMAAGGMGPTAGFSTSVPPPVARVQEADSPPRRSSQALWHRTTTDGTAASGATGEWVEAKRVWSRYHRHILPIAVASFFLSFGLWSLLGVENLALRAPR